MWFCCDFHHTIEKKVSWQNLSPGPIVLVVWSGEGKVVRITILIHFSKCESLFGRRRTKNSLSASQKRVTACLQFASLFICKLFQQLWIRISCGQLGCVHSCPFNYCLGMPPGHPASIMRKAESEHSLGLLAELLVFHDVGSCVIDLFMHMDFE